MRGRPYTPFKECYKVNKYGCWIWKRAMMLNGYGQKWHKGKFDGAHRVSWMLHRSTIPYGLSVLHRCDVRACVNPDHLFLGTQKENLLDMAKKGRSTSRFSHKDVRLMKVMRTAGKTLAEIGTVFNVRKQTIHEIVSGHTWKHIP